MARKAFLYPEQVALIVVMAILLVCCADWGLMDSKRLELLTYGMELDSRQKTALTQGRDEFYARLESKRQAQAEDILQNLADGKRLELGEWRKLPGDQLSPSLKTTAFRSYLLGSAAMDERNTYRALSRIRPSSLGYDPNFYMYGGSYLYLVGGLIYAGKTSGLIQINQDLSWYLDHPSQMARLYLAGRSISIAAFLAILVVLAAWSHRLGSRSAGILAMLTWSLSWLPWWEAIISKPHMYVAFWSLWLLFILDGWAQDRRAWRLWLAGAALGMAMGASLPAAILALALPVFIYEPGRGWSWFRYSLLGWLVAAALFFLTNPYAIISHEVYLLTAVEHLSGGGWNYGVVALDKPLAYFKQLTLESFAFPLVMVGLLATGVIAFRRQNPLNRLARLMAFLLLIWSLTVASDRIGLFLIAPICLFTGWALDQILLFKRRAPNWLSRTVLVLLLIPGLVSLAVQARAALSNELWYQPTKAWLDTGGLAPQVSVGVYEPPDPTRLPPFPFLNRPVMMLDKWKPDQNLPQVIILRSEEYERWWPHHPLNPRYELKTRLGSVPCPECLAYLQVGCPRHVYKTTLVLTPK